MKKILCFISALGLLAVGACTDSGTKPGGAADNIVPSKSDSINIWKVKMPEGRVGNLFVFDGVEGWCFSRRFESDSLGIYVDYNVTLLDLDVNIAHELFSLTRADLMKWDFISRTDSSAFNNNRHFDSSFYRDVEVMNILIDDAQKAFNSNLQHIYSLGPTVGNRMEYNARFDIYPIWVKDDYVTYAMRGSSFIGGGHDQTDNQLITFNCYTGKPVSFQDAFKADAYKKVSELVARHLAGQNIFDNMKTPTLQSYLDSLNNWRRCLPAGEGGPDVCSTRDIKATDFPLMEPAFTPYGVVMVYPKYTVAPGFAGTPQVVLTYKELNGMLKPPFEKLAESIQKDK
ncbi:MAG: RsiV family protein [Muribaculaceae bacterium]|nr:DUF3298 domain-containing protein [Bacteroidales bacterium]MDE6244007.1 RsiV family protein [Muribaculaceae bacterium]